MPDKKEKHAIVVFPDRETWSTLEGCVIKVIDNEQFMDLCTDNVDAGDIPGDEIEISDIFIPGKE
jgi:hypothetical protein